MYKIKEARKAFSLSAIAMGLATWGPAGAIDYYNLTTTGSTSGVISAGNNIDGSTVQAIFRTDANNVTVGTGVFDPFIRIGADNQNATNINQGANCQNGEDCIEVGYNTDGANTPPNDSKLDLQFQEKDSQGSNWNHTLATNTLQTVNEGGVDYYVFRLDINERSGGSSEPDKYLSLDQVRIFTSSSANVEGYCYQGSIYSGPGDPGNTYDPTKHSLGNDNCVGAGATDPANVGSLKAVFDMDLSAGGTVTDRSIALDYENGSGSGKVIDMFLFVEKAAITGDYVYFFSSFGEMGQVDKELDAKNTATKIPVGDFSQSDGFEEWSSLRKTPVAPTLALFAIGLLAMGGMRKLGSIGTRFA